MTSLRVEPYEMPAADLGPENPLPAFRNPHQDAQYDFDLLNIPQEDRPGLGWQIGSRVLPYRMQDGYNRDKKPRDFLSVVLENEFLKVRVLPEIGGRVISMVHKQANREMLYCNPVFQPANLALRNAWVSGGIEWNTAQPGHNHLTCSPLHTARVAGTKGDQVLRLYAWDRVKCFPYQIDLHLPDGSPFLFAHVRLINPHSCEIPMWWWTNMGVPEYPAGRVLCPAETAYKGITILNCPVVNGTDHSYATRVSNAYDFFFRIPEDQRPWEAILDSEGAGMVHTSTDRLRGRKMFVWGMGRGGRHWNEFLAVPNYTYQEIQAGLARTQMHSVPMPANTEWTWTEAFGYFESDPAKTHSPNWREAYQEAGRILDAALPRDAVDEFDRQANEVTCRAPEEILFRGLGWGALEKRRAAVMHERCGIPTELPFDDSDLCDEQEPWLRLLETGILPERDPQSETGHFMIQDAWRKLLEDSVQTAAGDHWLSHYHLGVMRLEDGDAAGAWEAWQRSVRHHPNGWALRNLAVIKTRNENYVEACKLLRQAWEVGPKIPALAAECTQSLLKVQENGSLREFIASLPEEIRNHERIQLAWARTALQLNNFEEVENMLEREFATVQEGEVSLTEIWFEMQARKLALNDGVTFNDDLLQRVRRELVPPYRIDFRMNLPEEDEYVPPKARDR